MATRWKSPDGAKYVLPDGIEPGLDWEHSGRRDDSEVNLTGLVLWQHEPTGQRVVGTDGGWKPTGKEWIPLGLMQDLPRELWPREGPSTIREALWGSSSSRERAASVARLVESASWVFLAAGVLFGVWVALHREQLPRGISYPNVRLGIGIAVGSAFQALVVIMIATYVQARLEDMLLNERARSQPAPAPVSDDTAPR